MTVVARDQALGISGRAAILFGGVLPAIGTGTMAVMLPAISDAFGTATNSVLVKMVSTATGLGMMVGAATGGILADRFGRRPVLALAALLFGVFGCGAMLGTALWQLILARFVIGLAAGALAGGFIAVIGDNFADKEQSRWLGYNGAIATLSIVVLIPLAGLLVDTGWRHGFLIYAAGFPMLALILRGIPRRAPVTKQAPLAPNGSPSSAIPWSPIGLAVIVGTIAAGTPLYWPFRLRDLGVVSARDIALYALPNILMVVVGTLAFSPLRRRLSANAVFIVAALCSAAGLALIAAADRPAVALLGLLFEGFGVGLITPNLSKYAISVAPRDRSARAIGLMKGALFGSPFLTQFALEPMSRAGGPSAALLGICAVSAAFAAFLALRITSKGLRWTPEPSSAS